MRDITRRSFLGLILASGVAPAIVRASSLMRLPPPRIILPGDDGYNAIYFRPDGTMEKGLPSGYSVRRHDVGLYTVTMDSAADPNYAVIITPKRSMA